MKTCCIALNTKQRLKPTSMLRELFHEKPLTK
nr:MAG TPA: hypothetical protein [Caudoviricetes sp.]